MCYNIFMKPSVDKNHICPITEVAELLSDPWTIRIIHSFLKQEKNRFCELEQLLDGISTRTLTLKLKHLEDKEIISKSDSGYIITVRGKKLEPIISAMEKFPV